MTSIREQLEIAQLGRLGKAILDAEAKGFARGVEAAAQLIEGRDLSVRGYWREPAAAAIRALASSPRPTDGGTHGA